MNKPVTKAGRYQIISELGRGAMGVVYEGFDPVIGRAVAIKTMLTEGLSGNEFETYRARFQREAQAAGILAHPNIVTIYDFGEDDGFLFLAMELMKGKSLEKLLQEQSVLPIETIIPIYQQVCSALDFAHQHKIVHRDIKPANIMILENGLIKVADFGIAKMMATGMTRAGQILGTPNYMSPEQVKGRHVDGRSDIFALGVILYELVTGEKPFSGQNVTTVIYKIMNENPIPPRELEPTIHPGLSYVITKALAKGIDERYQTCNELAEDLKNYRNLGMQASPSSTQTIQRPMLELAPNETAAIDVSMVGGPAHARPKPPVQPPTYTPQVQTRPASEIRTPVPPAAEVRPAAQAPAPPPPAPPAPRMQASPQIQPAPVEPPPVEPPRRVVTAPEVKPAPPVQSPPPIRAAPRVEPRVLAEPAPVVETPRAQAPVQPAPMAPAAPTPQPSAEITRSPQAEASPAPVADTAQPVVMKPAAKRTSPLVWAAVAALLVIAGAGGYFLPHRGGVRPINPPTASAPNAGSAATQAGQGVEIPKASPPPVGVKPSQNTPQVAASAPATERPQHAIPVAEAPKAPSSRPQTEASAGGNGEVAITANVDGAKISIDGKGEPDWVAPHTFSLPPGNHRVAVLKDGFVTWGKSVTVEAGGKQSIDAQLSAPQGEVDIVTDPAGLEVFIDGKSVGMTPVDTMVSIGDHKYKISPPPGQSPFEGTITAKETSIARKKIAFR